MSFDAVQRGPMGPVDFAAEELIALARRLRGRIDLPDDSHAPPKTVLAIAYMKAVNLHWWDAFSNTPGNVALRTRAIETCRREHAILESDAPEFHICHAPFKAPMTVATMHGSSKHHYPQQVPVLDYSLGEARPLWVHYAWAIAHGEIA